MLSVIHSYMYVWITYFVSFHGYETGSSLRSQILVFLRFTTCSTKASRVC